MKFFARKSRFFVALAAVGMMTFTSCNRGMGCPTNFSFNEFLEECVTVAVNFLF
ncbi:MAG: hypothetical protein AAFZ52_09325 [Bacteroidota bacterium]